MNRLEEMIEYLFEAINQALENGKQYYLKQLEQEKEIRRKEFINIQREIVHEDTSSIVITYLHSSYITYSHIFRITAYKREPFVEENPSFINYDMQHYFIGCEAEVMEWKSMLEKKFIRIINSEVESIRRYYMKLRYQSSILFFQQLLEPISEHHEQRHVPIYFGDEMGELAQIGMGAI